MDCVAVVVSVCVFCFCFCFFEKGSISFKVSDLCL